MCGLTGFWSPHPLPPDAERTGACMAGTLAHRGPDDAGTWSDPAAGIVLAHRRLSIIDLSAEGHQPMRSASGRWVLSYNGEVYNFAELRRELESRDPALRLRGHSDTEVMLAAFDAWGVDGALQRFVGMFAFALWDRAEQRLHLVRDRLGIKPLYYGRAGDTLVFGSELKALEAHPEFERRTDRGALALLLRHGYIPAPHSIYRDVRKLPAGSILTLRAPADDAAPRAWWSLTDVARAGSAHPLEGSDAEHVDRLDAALRDAVRLRMVADVPLGAFLSGGIDSSTVVALMQAQSERPVRTFTIAMPDRASDESADARAVAAHLGTEHTELRVTGADALALIPRLPEIWDEPFADASQIPTLLVAQLARGHVTVALSGDGGDELFGGYNRHLWGGRVWDASQRVPAPLRHAGGRLLDALTPGQWDRLYGSVAAVLPRSLRMREPGFKAHRLAQLLGAETRTGLYRDVLSYWPEPHRVVRDGAEPRTVLDDAAARLPSATFAEQMMLLDALLYLPDDILTKVDRASMATGLEARVPLLDHRVVELAWRLPLRAKIRDGAGKWVLRQVLHRYVPAALVDRPKAGFAIPFGEWLRGPLRDWAESLLDEARLHESGLDARPVRAAWGEHMSGRRRAEFQLWPVLMYQAWLERSQASAAALPC